MLLPHVVMADVIACRLMELSTEGVGGRWNSHWVNALVLILLFCVIPHPICVADGIVTLVQLYQVATTSATKWLKPPTNKAKTSA